MPLAPAALEALLRIALIPGIGQGRLEALVRHFGSADRVLGASSRELSAVPRFGGRLAQRLAEHSSTSGAQVAAAIAAMARTGAVALTPDDLSYPRAFREIPDAPFLLYACGRLELLNRRSIAVVGTREPSDYGRSTAAALARDLASAGYLVVSGMAKGIDAEAHAASLDAGAGSIGVLGNGIDRVYPAENRALFGRMRAEGLLVTEFAPGEMPAAGNFPRRNRLIAALSDGVLVVEMGSRSGAQHTVTYALEQGREVFAVPGQIGAPSSAGTNQLLKEGARLVTSAADIVEELRGVGFASDRSGAPVQVAPAAQPIQPLRAATPELPQEQAAILALLGQPLHIDELAMRRALPPHVVLGTLLEMELLGIVESLPGKHFRRA